MRSGPRPGLDRKTRSCITLTALVALGRLDELELHVRAAVRNGLTEQEIGEVFLQSAVYAGARSQLRLRRGPTGPLRTGGGIGAYAGRDRGGRRGCRPSHLLHLEGIESVVLERRSREDLETTVRAGVLEYGTAELLEEVGVGERMPSRSSVHHGIELRFDGRGHRIDFADLTDGLSIIIGRQEVVKDLIRARLEADGKILFEARAESVEGLDTESPKIHFQNGQQEEISCDYVAGCDGSFGVCRSGIPEDARARVHQNLSLWVVRHPRRGTAIDGGVDLHPPRPRLRPGQHPLSEVQRLYFQCDPQDDVEEWADERIWDELSTRLATHDGWELAGGEIFQKDIVQMRSFVCEPMQHGRLFLPETPRTSSRPRGQRV